MRQIYLILLLVTVYSISAHAQYQGGGGGQRRAGGGNMTGRMYGKIVDEKTNKGIDAATIELIQSKFDTLTRKRKDTVITGMLTRSNGDFSLENIPLFGQFRITITAIGHEPIDMKVAFDMKGMQGGNMEAALNASDKDLGNIKMKQDAKVLEGVTVTASKPMVEMKIDRKVFNVDKNITSAGGSTA